MREGTTRSPAGLHCQAGITNLRLFRDGCRIKLPLHGQHSVRKFWLADLTAKELHVCRDPHTGEGRDMSTLAAADLHSVTTADGLHVDPAGLFNLAD